MTSLLATLIATDHDPACTGECLAEHRSTPAPPVDPRLCLLCHKVTYGRRQNAKRALRRLHPGDRMQVYPCPRGGFHFGHPQEDTREAERQRHEGWRR